MRKSKFTHDQINTMLAEADRDGIVPVADRYGISKQALYAWRTRFGGGSEPPRRPQGDAAFKRQLDEPVATDLEDFCAAHYGAPAINVVREALKLFITDQLARDPELKKRFDRLREERSNRSERQDSLAPPSRALAEEVEKAARRSAIKLVRDESA
jgi:hypothetical protein